MKLVFVYNAGSGRLNTLLDIGHKLLSPETYACALCSLTHGVFREKRVWKEFRERGGIDCTFLHKDEFEARFPQYQFELPVVLKDDGELSVLLSAEELREIRSVEALIERFG